MSKLTCRICKFEAESPYRLAQHRKLNHPETLRKNKNQTINVDSPMNQYVNLKKQANGLIEKLEQERTIYHNRIIELDNAINKIKKLDNCM